MESWAFFIWPASTAGSNQETTAGESRGTRNQAGGVRPINKAIWSWNTKYVIWAHFVTQFLPKNAVTLPGEDFD
jgi:hypothetical protein